MAYVAYEGSVSATRRCAQLADVAPLLKLLPVLATSLDAMPQREMRALFYQLNLEVSYQPGEHALDVALTRYDERGHDQTEPAWV